MRENTKMNLKTNLESIQKKAKERTVKTQNIEYDLETMVKKIDKGVIKLNPEYQRNHRWSNETSSRLIESLILNIPIPVIYISQDIDVDDEDVEGVARYSVIDGQQRLTSIYKFFKGEYALEGLETLNGLNGTYYKDLPSFLIRRLEERTIKSLRIDSTVDAQVKYDIFERLNSGSVKLEPQELRNATCRGEFKDLIKELSKNEIFTKISQLSKNSAKVRKMEDQELVLRLFSFAHNHGYKKYSGGIKHFLTDEMKKFNDFSTEEIGILKGNFLKTIVLINKQFGDMPFAKYRVNENGEYKRMSTFNVAVFDAVVVPFYNLVVQDKNTNVSYNEFKALFANVEFFSSVETSTNDVTKVKTRINKGFEVIK